MKCPQCDGELEPQSLRDNNGEPKDSKRCNQCGGFWFNNHDDENLSINSVEDYDSASPNYSLQSSNLTCPDDQTMLNESEREALPNGLHIWQCPECSGTFYPRGQLALATNWAMEQAKDRSLSSYPRSRIAMAVILVFLMFGAIVINVTGAVPFQAAGQTLPTQGPNILALVLIAVAYLAGTVLAVLGRKLAVVMVGWGVIIICLIGFTILIFSP